MTRLAAMALLLLAGCADREETQDAAADAAADAAYDAVADAGFEERIADLESRIEELESSDDLQEQNILTAYENNAETQAYAEAVSAYAEDHITAVESRLGM